MNNCLNCGKPIDEGDTTRREKKYCNSTCRAAYHQKKNAGKKKYVRIETFEALKKKLEDVIAENNKPENKKRIEEERNTPNNIGEKHEQPLTELDVEERAKIENEIKRLEYEINHVPKGISIPQRIYISTRQNDIYKLRKKLQQQTT